MIELRHWTVGATLACLCACGGSPEQATVDQFFRAAQTNDQSTIAAMSAAAPPGEVTSWTVVEVGARSTERFELPALLEEFKIAETERNASLEERRTYLEEERDALEQIIPKLQEDPEYKFRGRLGEIQTEWLRLIEDRKVKEGKFQQLKRATDTETRLASKSVMNRVSLEEFDGDVSVTEMLLQLQSPEGDERPYRVTLRKYDLAAEEGGRVEPSRWIIADIEGTGPESAVASSAPAGATSEPAVVEAVAADASASDAPPAAPAPRPAASEQPARSAPAVPPREMRGVARVQMLAPETKVEGDDVVSRLRVRNVSNGWITRFTVTEHWYDQQGNATRGASRTHDGRFMPGEVVELELRTRKNESFYQNQFEFSHANGDVNATIVGSFPEAS